MPITASKNDLASALTWVSRALPSRPLVPVLGGIKLSLEKKVLTLSALDNEQSAAAKIKVADGEDLEIIVAGKVFVEVVKALSNDTVVLKKDEESRHLVVESGRSKFSIPLMPAMDYPDLPTIPETFGSISGALFADAVKRVSTAAGLDTSLPVLTAVYVKADPQSKMISLASTDRFRLATTSLSYIPTEGQEEEKIFLVPARILDSYMKIFADLEEIKLHSGGSSNSIFGVSGADKVATTRLLDGKFPAYESLLPTSFKASPEVDINDMIAALKRVSLVAEKAQSVKLIFSGNELQVAVGDLSKSAQAGTEYLETNYEEEESFTIAFNPNYLVDGLQAIDASTAKFNLVEETKPVLVTATSDSDYKYLIMPTRMA